MIAYCVGLFGSLVHGVGGFYVWEVTSLLRMIITGVSRKVGLDILLYRFSAAIFIPLFCLYINGDDILVRGLGRFELLDTMICCYLASWLFCVKPRGTGYMSR